jgi:N-acetylneuraminic acid mutarotase
MVLIRIFCVAFWVVLPALTVRAQHTADSAGWEIVRTDGAPEKREDCAFAAANGLLYLIGGRGIKTVDVYHPAGRLWTHNKPTPMEIHHFQAVAWKQEIYAVGAMNGRYPHERPFDSVYIYNPERDNWRPGAAIPANRRRGSGGAVVYRNQIYFVCGIQDGHYGGTVAWFDVFDPRTGNWKALPNAPHARDHFHAAVIGHELYVAGGRQTSARTNQVADLTEHAVDVYNFSTGQWRTLDADKNLPTARAGCTAVALGHLLYVIGGESVDQEGSHREVECYDTKKHRWLAGPPLQTGRHDMQALGFRKTLYIAAGSANRGGGPDLNTLEVLPHHFP